MLGMLYKPSGVVQQGQTAQVLLSQHERPVQRIQPLEALLARRVFGVAQEIAYAITQELQWKLCQVRGGVFCRGGLRLSQHEVGFL